MFKNFKEKASKFYRDHKCEICYFAGGTVVIATILVEEYLYNRKIRTGNLGFVMGERKEKPGCMYLGLVLKDKNDKIIKSMYGGDSAEGMKNLGLGIVDVANRILNKETE